MSIRTFPFRMVEFSEITLGDNPRTRVNPDALEALSRSIKRVGLVVPLVLNRELVLLDGYRRHQVLAGLGCAQKVPCVLVDEEAEAVILAVDGGHRGWGMYDRARHWARLAALGWTDSDIAAATTKAAPVVRHAREALAAISEQELQVRWFSPLLEALRLGVPITESVAAIQNGKTFTAMEARDLPMVRAEFPRWYLHKASVQHLMLLSARRTARKIHGGKV